MGQISMQFHVGGMTCVNCQNKIQRKLRSLPGVKTVSVSYQTGIALIVFDSGKISLNRIREAVEQLGYAVLTDDRARKPDIGRIICFLAVILSLYGLLERFGILNLLVPSQLADNTMGYGMLFVVGLLTSVHCIAMCGGINLSQCLPKVSGGDSAEKQAYFLPSFLYNLGRVVSYTVIGFLLGSVGWLLGGNSGAGIPALVQGILKMAAGAVMVIMGINMLGIFPWLRRLNLRLPDLITKTTGKNAAGKRPFIVGLLNGLMPCGPLQSVQILALASGNPFAGAFSMLMFSLGTVPLMLGFGTLVSALGKRFSHAVMHAGAVLVAVLGLAMFSQGGSLSGLILPNILFFLVAGLSVIGVAASIPFSRKAYRAVSVILSCALVIAAGAAWQYFDREEAAASSGKPTVDGIQLVDSTLQPGRYPTITVQAGIPVRWTIHAPAESINGCNYKMIIPEYGIEHIFAEGENIIEFTPADTGTVPYTCWMGMIRSSITVTESSGSGQANAAGNASAQNSEDDTGLGNTQVIASGEYLVIPTSEISSAAVFYPIEVDGVGMEVLAIKAPDGTIRTAFNTCQMCYTSGAGYYVQEGEYLICQNCGSHFTADQVEHLSGGCNPWPISAEEKTVTADSIQISYDILKEASAIFANWKRPSSA